MINIVKLHRYNQDIIQSLSICTIIDCDNNPLFTSIALERGWLGNRTDVSCIPSGTYEVVLEWSDKFQTKLWEVKGVPNRTECKFHSANYWNQLNGCISLGRRPRFLNSDRYLDVTGSKNTMKDFHRVLKNETKFTLVITTEPNIF